MPDYLNFLGWCFAISMLLILSYAWFARPFTMQVFLILLAGLCSFSAIELFQSSRSTNIKNKE